MRQVGIGPRHLVEGEWPYPLKAKIVCVDGGCGTECVGCWGGTRSRCGKKGCAMVVSDKADGILQLMLTGKKEGSKAGSVRAVGTWCVV